MSASLRLATPDDAPAVAEVYAPHCLTPVSFELQPPSADDMRARIVKTLAAHPWLVCEAGGEVVGYAYAGPHRDRAAYVWSVDVSVYVRADRHRGGVGRGLYTALFGVLAAQRFVTAHAGITLPNPASVGLHTSLGFEPVGVYRSVGFKAGAWHDVGWYARPLGPRPVAPAPPRPLAAVVGTAAWDAALAAGRAVLRA